MSDIRSLKKELSWYKKALIEQIAGEGGRDKKEVKIELENEYKEYLEEK
jgi:hypothetical protein